MPISRCHRFKLWLNMDAWMWLGKKAHKRARARFSTRVWIVKQCYGARLCAHLYQKRCINILSVGCVFFFLPCSRVTIVGLSGIRNRCYYIPQFDIYVYFYLYFTRTARHFLLPMWYNRCASREKKSHSVMFCFGSGTTPCKAGTHRDSERKREWRAMPSNCYWREMCIWSSITSSIMVSYIVSVYTANKKKKIKWIMGVKERMNGEKKRKYWVCRLYYIGNTSIFSA